MQYIPIILSLIHGESVTENDLMRAVPSSVRESLLLHGNSLPEKEAYAIKEMTILEGQI